MASADQNRALEQGSDLHENGSSAQVRCVHDFAGTHQGAQSMYSLDATIVMAVLMTMCLIAYGRLVSATKFPNPLPFTAMLLLLSVPLHSAELAGAASAAELGSRYSQARARNNTVAYSVLVCWDRVLPPDRQSMESGFAEDAGTTATNLRFLTLDEMDQLIRKAGGMGPVRKPVSRGGVTYDFNLPVIGYLWWDAGTRDGQSQGSGAVPVGMKDGRFFITTRAPVPSSPA
jgi:hypothetical protein